MTNNGNKTKQNRIEAAKKLVKKLFANEYKPNGEAYTEHAKGVVALLEKAGVTDQNVLIAAMLCSTVELQDNLNKDIETNFGSDVLQILKQLRILAETRVKRHSPKEFNEKHIIQTYLNLAKDMRALVIKLAIKAHEIKLAHNLSGPDRKRAAERALYLYAPMARLVGISSLATILEDRAFVLLNPRDYYEINEMIENLKPEIDIFFKKNISAIQELLEYSGIKPLSISKRVKSVYGVYKKAVMKGHASEYVYDVAAIKIIVKSIEECYKTEDILKQLWDSIPGERDDYIQQPKATGYKALHNVFKISEKLDVEVQVKTQEMEDLDKKTHVLHKMKQRDEEKYKALESALSNDLKSSESSTQQIDSKSWSEELNYWELETKAKDAKDKLIEISHFRNNVYAFTPDGDIIKLPRGANVIDFAYAVHTKIGNTCVGCNINGKIAKLDTVVQDGDTIEIKTLRGKNKPSEEWLNTVKTKHARESIRQALRKD